MTVELERIERLLDRILDEFEHTRSELRACRDLIDEMQRRIDNIMRMLREVDR